MADWTNWARTASDAARARRSCSAGGSPRRSDSRRAAAAARWACLRFARSSAANWPAICVAAVLMKVPGP